MVVLDWTYSDPRVTAFVVERKAGDKGDFTQIALLDKDAREFTDTNGTPTTKYVYRMRATDGVEYSDYSNEASVTTPRQEQTITLVSVARCDGFIAEPTKKANCGGMAFPSSAGPAAIRAGDTSLNQQVKGILSFGTWQLPDNAAILSARLSLKRGVIYGDPLSSLGRCVVDIKGGSGFGKVTTLEPVDFQALPSKKRAALLTPVGDDSGWYTAQIDSKCFQFISRTAVTQFRIYFEIPDNGDLAPDYIGWYSGECPIPENRPVLEILYR